MDRNPLVADEEDEEERERAGRGQMLQDEETSRAFQEAGWEDRRDDREGRHEKTRQFAIEFASDFLAARRSVF